jgi:peptidoglycan/LPS O-acetylase OafA/YrhL
VSHRAGNLLGGWSKDNFWDGGARVLYSFTAGLVIYRYNLIIRNKLGLAGLASLLAAVFVMPHWSWNWLAEWLVVLVGFPLLVALGAGAVPSATSRKLCVFAGDMSYPLYMTHYWAIWIFGNYLLTRKPAAGQLTVIVVFGTLFLVGFAWLAMVLYDLPVRSYLTRKREQRMHPEKLKC